MLAGSLRGGPAPHAATICGHDGLGRQLRHATPEGNVPRRHATRGAPTVNGVRGAAPQLECPIPDLAVNPLQHVVLQVSVARAPVPHGKVSGPGSGTGVGCRIQDVRDAGGAAGPLGGAIGASKQEAYCSAHVAHGLTSQGPR